MRLDQFHLICMDNCLCNQEIEMLLKSKEELDKIKCILNNFHNKSFVDNIEDIKEKLQGTNE